MSAIEIISIFRIGLLLVCALLFWLSFQRRLGIEKVYIFIGTGLFVVLALAAIIRQWASNWLEVFVSAAYTPYLSATCVVLAALYFSQERKP